MEREEVGGNKILKNWAMTPDETILVYHIIGVELDFRV